MAVRMLPAVALLLITLGTASAANMPLDSASFHAGKLPAVLALV